MKILAFGEILFDIFDDMERLGGAPLNFLANMVNLGAQGYILSAVSDDRLGQNAINSLKNIGIDYSFTNTGSLFGTGFCKVEKDERGEPTYDLALGVAYDHITVSDEELQRIEQEDFDVFYFGTLAQRNISSKATLDKIFDSCNFKKVFFDINLRQNFYSNDIIKSGLEHADILKINYSECATLCDMGFCTSHLPDRNDNVALASLCGELCSEHGLEAVIITLDKDGACAYSHATEEFCRSTLPGREVVLTVGAGDAFSACFVYNYLDGKPLSTCLERANLLGDYTVGFLGAIPPYSEEVLEKIRG